MKLLKNMETFNKKGRGNMNKGAKIYLAGHRGLVGSSIMRNLKYYIEYEREMREGDL